MNLGLPEIAIVVIIVLLLFGPDRIPQIARQIGQAQREYQQTLAGMRDATNLQSQSANLQQQVMREPTDDEKLIESAKKLGIETKGKTIEQISAEILEKTS